MSATKSTGDSGEAIAARYLQANGYSILATNWRCVGGEIDIVAQQGDTLVFVEVKSRRGGQSGDALLAITPAKRQRLTTAAYAYVDSAGLDDPAWRIDAVAVIFGRDGMARCTHVENALDW